MKVWTATADGRRRSTLVTKKNKQDKQLQKNQPVDSPLSVSEMEEYIDLQKKFGNLTKPRDDKNQQKKNYKLLLNAHKLARKRDKNSVHNQLERHAKSNGLDRGKAFGGKYDGKVARAVMEDPGKIYNGMRDILKNSRESSVEEDFIDTLLDDVIELMKAWNEFFSLLQQEEPTDEERSRAKSVADNAVKKHYALLKNKTPKAHVAEDHAVDQYLTFRRGFVRLLIEHWVEQNHQEGYKIEQQFKRVPGHEAKADFTAKARHRSNNAEIQTKIKWVDGKNSRGKYKKRTSPSAAVSPSPQKRPRQQKK